MDDAAGLYETNFYAWTQSEARAIRAAATSRINLPIDWENIAEEIESLGRSDRRELRSRPQTVMAHLLDRRNAQTRSRPMFIGLACRIRLTGVYVQNAVHGDPIDE